MYQWKAIWFASKTFVPAKARVISDSEILIMDLILSTNDPDLIFNERQEISMPINSNSLCFRNGTRELSFNTRTVYVYITRVFKF